MAIMAFTLRTDEELEIALAELAAAEGLSKQEVARRAILERHRRRLHRARVDEASQRLIEEWGDVLDRLGKA